jgi:branched-chain amino acid transport system ATP-binding protein
VIARPRLLLLDEPASGLSLTERETIAEAIDRVRTELGVPILVIEHDMDLMASLCDRTIVMDTGRVLAEGNLTELLTREDVSLSLLGTPPRTNPHRTESVPT